MKGGFNCNSEDESKKWLTMGPTSETENNLTDVEEAIDGMPRQQAINQTNKVTSSSSSRPTLHREHTPVAGLQLSCYRIDATNGNLHDADLDDAIARKGNSSYWIDADVRDGEDARELHEIIEKIDLTPFLKRHLAKPYQIQTPQVLSQLSCIFLVMRVLPPEEDKSNEMRYVAALCIDGVLLTVTTKPKDGKAAYAGHLLNQSTRKAVQERELPEASTSGALAMWLLFQVQRLATVTNALRKACFDMDKQLDENIDKVKLDDIVALKNNANAVVAVSEEQLECIENLKEAESISSGVNFSKLRGSFGLVMATAGATERLAGRLEKKVVDLRNAYDSNQQDRINRRLEIMTILSAIFLPLTLMAGLWGMNFTNMPELQRPNGYYFALSGMLGVALILIFTFYRFGWLR